MPRLPSALVIACLVAVSCQREAPPSFGAIVEAESLGATYLDANDLPRAESAFKRLITLAPKDAGAHTKLGVVYLRMNRPKDAEEQFRQAAGLDTTSVDAQLLLAELMRANGHGDAARQTLTALTTRTPVDPKVYYALAQLARANPDSARARADERTALEKLVTVAPGNVPARVAFARALVASGQADSALAAVEALEQLPPSLPRDTRAPLDDAVAALRRGDLARASASLATSEHFLEVTAPYQAGLEQLRAPQIALSGLPQLTLPTTESMRERLARGDSDAAIVFRDATGRLPLLADSGAGVSALAVGDYDGDGSDDIFVSVGDSGRARLVHWERGTWLDAARAAGVDVVGAMAATFADFDGDGRLDLYVVDRAGRGYLFLNDGAGHFRDVAARAGVAAPGATTRVVAVDLDHDGDMDLVLAQASGIRYYRNNADGTFTDATTIAGFADTTGRGGRAFAGLAFGDVDDDGLLDIVASSDAGTAAYHNDRQRRLSDDAATRGLGQARGAALDVADYDNDGYLDLFIGGVFYRNTHDGHFARDDRAKAVTASLAGLTLRDARFVDYDNDGRLDLVVAGTALHGNGVRLWHNDGNGRFSDRTAIVPVIGDARLIAVSDVDRDRDLDLVVVGPGGARVLRNDGGNRNLAVEVALTGLATGSGKNNALGIGATLDVRVGDLYQRRTVTGRVTTIGLGHHLKADVVRVDWPNGVPQTVYLPGSDQDVVENQVLKSSCGFLYAWNGTRFEFVTDLMWRSALGMPVGIGGNGGATFAPAAASKEYLKIPRGALVADRGRYRVQLTEELWETSYTDQLSLVAVDHPDSVDEVVDERFVPPGGPVSLDVYATRHRRPPASAVDEHGTDLMPALRDADFRFAATFALDRFQGVTEPHDLIIDLGPDLGAGQVLLLLRGWIFPTDASINVSLSQGHAAPVAWPVLDVMDAWGRWRPAITDMSIPSGKNKLVVLDLTGKFPTRDHRVRIRTNAQIYWDQASVATTAPRAPATITRLSPMAAEVHYRGFSRTYRKGGRYGPHWFDYASVRAESPWRPIDGRFTRYGDVRSLLQSSDDEYIIMAPGDETSIDFDAAAAPPLPPGWVRDFFVYSDGWIKDADLNTAFGGTVAPLPFHAMTGYPYPAGQHYPADSTHRRYLDQFDTRQLSGTRSRVH